MDHDTQTYLDHFGKQNIFSILSEDECRTMLTRFENILEQEEQIAQEVGFLKGASLKFQETYEYNLTPPHGLPSVQLSEPIQLEEPIHEEEVTPTIPTEKPWFQIHRGILSVMVCALIFTGGWSVALYSWAFEKGLKRGSTLATVAQLDNSRPLVFPSRSFLLRQPKLVHKKAAFQSNKQTFSLQASIKPKHFGPSLPERIFSTKLGVLQLTAPQFLDAPHSTPHKVLRKARLLEKEQVRLSVEKETFERVGFTLQTPHTYRLPQNALSFSLPIWRNDPERYSM